MPATRYFPAGTSELTEPAGEVQTQGEPSGHQGGAYCSPALVGFQIVGTVLSSFLLLSSGVGLKDMVGQCMGILDEPKQEGPDLEENHLPRSSVLSLLCYLVFWGRDSGKISPTLSLLADKRSHYRTSVIMHPSHGPDVRGTGKECFPSFLSFRDSLASFLVLQVPYPPVEAPTVTKLLCNTEWELVNTLTPQSVTVSAKSQGTTQAGCVGAGNRLDSLLAQVDQCLSGEGRRRGGSHSLAICSLRVSLHFSLHAR